MPQAVQRDVLLTVEHVPPSATLLAAAAIAETAPE
jgi:hypothetical protein